MAIDPGEIFGGIYRKAVKTSIVRDPSGDIAQFDPTVGDVGALLGSLVPDAEMIQKYPGLVVDPAGGDAAKEAAPSTRFPEEQRNVSVRAFLWYARKESDNDYHVIVGSTADATAQYMNVEVSGLPAAGPDLGTLQQVRAELTGIFGGVPCGMHYEALTPPLAVQVEGSLLFDGDHKVGEIGPPATSRRRSGRFTPSARCR